jgi:multidrug resistance efflux pump
MKIRVDIQDIHQEMEAADSNAMLGRVKDEAARRAPLLLRGLIKSMSDLSFAQEVVKRANASRGTSHPAPQSAQEFLDWGVSNGFVTIIEP